jgi:hypothetical protein
MLYQETDFRAALRSLHKVYWFLVRRILQPGLQLAQPDLLHWIDLFILRHHLVGRSRLDCSSTWMAASFAATPYSDTGVPKKSQTFAILRPAGASVPMRPTSATM